jgi:hypothetical protein
MSKIPCKTIFVSGSEKTKKERKLSKCVEAAEN